MATYTFKHALIRDAAYEALLKSRRRELHKHIASTLEERFPELVKSQAEVAAHHCTEACGRASYSLLAESGRKRTRAVRERGGDRTLDQGPRANNYAPG